MRFGLDDLRGRRVLLVASTGGHLTQLTRLAPELGIDPASPWVTFDTPQSRSLLRGREVHFVPYVSPRDYAGVWQAAQAIRPVLKDVDGALSTGAGVALAVLPQVLLQRKPVVYLESISRILGPSLTGRILARLPRIGLYAQHSGWLSPPWRQGPSVLAQYATEEVDPIAPRKMLVTLGTIKPYRFDRLIDAVLAHHRRHPDLEITWQVGCTTRDDLPGRVEEQLSDAAFASALQSHDVIVAHSGVGVAMNILDSGRLPLLLERRRAGGEHVDDHQAQILHYLVGRGLALRADDALTDDACLMPALNQRVRRVVTREREDFSER